MNQSKFNSIYGGLTSAAKKVYDYVPLAGQQTSREMYAELVRVGKSMDFSIFEGCLRSLKESGLIAENQPGKFVRKIVRVNIKDVQEVEVTINNSEKTVEPKAEKKSNIDLLAALAKRTSEMSAMLKVLATDIENAALSIEEENQAKAKEQEKIQQLVQLLKSLG